MKKEHEATTEQLAEISRQLHNIYSQVLDGKLSPFGVLRNLKWVPWLCTTCITSTEIDYEKYRETQWHPISCFQSDNHNRCRNSEKLKQELFPVRESGKKIQRFEYLTVVDCMPYGGVGDWVRKMNEESGFDFRDYPILQSINRLGDLLGILNTRQLRRPDIAEAYDFFKISNGGYGRQDFAEHPVVIPCGKIILPEDENRRERQVAKIACVGFDSHSQCGHSGSYYLRPWAELIDLDHQFSSGTRILGVQVEDENE